jgi:magnesium chelatase family protein
MVGDTPIWNLVLCPLDYEKLSGDRVGESSESIRARVQAARGIQHHPFSKNGSADIVCNVDMRVGDIRQFCRLREKGQRLMRVAMTQLILSARVSSSAHIGADNRGSGGV